MEVDEVISLDDVGAARAAVLACEERLHCWRAGPRTHHGIGNLKGV